MDRLSDKLKYFNKISFKLWDTMFYVTLEIEHEKSKWKLTTNLQPIEEYHTFSFFGSYKDWGWQCYDEILEASMTEPLVVQKLIKELVDLWKTYHLNDFKAGTVQQKAAVDKRLALGNKYEYSAVCDHLKEIGMYEFHWYKYGHSWLVEYYNPQQVDDVVSKWKNIVEKLDLLQLTPDYERQTRKWNY